MHNIKRVSIDFPENLYRIIKTFTAFNDSSVKSFVLDAVSKELTKNNIKIPNEETMKTFEDTDKGKNLHSYDSFNALLSEIQTQSE
jgi:hypothetical protein